MNVVAVASGLRRDVVAASPPIDSSSRNSLGQRVRRASTALRIWIADYLSLHVALSRRRLAPSLTFYVLMHDQRGAGWQPLASLPPIRHAAFARIASTSVAAASRLSLAVPALLTTAVAFVVAPPAHAGRAAAVEV
jgi:hypothetical protein